MKKRTRRLLGGLVLADGAVGAAGAILMKKSNTLGRGRRGGEKENSWARPGMTVVFRAELMPGRDGSERSFRVTKLLPSGRVMLEGVAGEHTETEFERVR